VEYGAFLCLLAACETRAGGPYARPDTAAENESKLARPG
jgi:hypothetical protein